MPIALLLGDTFKPLMKGLARLNPWVRMVALEETLIDRARSAFLVHWFGHELPLDGRRLRIHIVNLDHLRRRYLAVKKAHDKKREENLAEPLGGIAGSLVGLWLSPTGILSFLVVKLRKIPGQAKDIVKGIGTLLLDHGRAAAYGPIGSAVAMILLPIGGAALALLLGDGGTAAMARSLETAARFCRAVSEFAGQLLGPREEIKNPLLYQVLRLGDLMAALMPHVIGFAAFLIVRVGPVLGPLAEQIGAIVSLAGAVFDLIGAAIGQITGSVGRGLQGAFKILVALLAGLPGATWRTLSRVGKRISGPVSAFGTELGHLFDDWKTREFDRRMAAIKGAFAPFGELFKTLAKQIDLMKKLDWSSPPGFGGKALDKLLDLTGIKGAWTPPATADFPEVEKTPWVGFGKSMAGLAAIGSMKVPSAIPPGAKGVKQVRTDVTIGPHTAHFSAAAAIPDRRPHLFRKDLHLLDKTLADLRKREAPLREHILAVVDRVLPAEMRAQYPILHDAFIAVEKGALAAPDRPGAPRLPLLQVDTNVDLLPVIRRLELRVEGEKVKEAEAAAFRDKLTAAMRGRTYAVAGM
jgi:hypothetical protein